MFFEGTLQEGISAALQKSKLVVCFVTGMYLSPQPLIHLSQYTNISQTVALRVRNGKQSLWQMIPCVCSLMNSLHLMIYMLTGL
jgi:hypothetical protein